MKPAILAFGFLRAALAVFFFHQAVIGFDHGMGWGPNPPFRPNPIPPFGVPQIWNACFWGGLFALPLVVGAWIVVPLIKGGAFFANGNPTPMLRRVGIYGVSGLGLALFWRGLPALFRKG